MSRVHRVRCLRHETIAVSSVAQPSAAAAASVHNEPTNQYVIDFHTSDAISSLRSRLQPPSPPPPLRRRRGFAAAFLLRQRRQFFEGLLSPPDAASSIAHRHARLAEFLYFLAASFLRFLSHYEPSLPAEYFSYKPKGRRLRLQPSHFASLRFYQITPASDCFDFCAAAPTVMFRFSPAASSRIRRHFAGFSAATSPFLLRRFDEIAAFDSFRHFDAAFALRSASHDLIELLSIFIFISLH